MHKTPEQKKHEQGAALIRKAFERARESGSPEWQTMTAAVLKNRLLDLTEREFKESDWDAESFREFLEQFGDVVTVVPDVRPLQVTLRQEDGSQEAASAAKEVDRPRDLGPRRLVRRDLWDAILDYSSGSRYAWDGQRALVVEPGNAEKVDESRLLPTLSEAEFKSWRSEFVNVQSAKNPNAGALLYTWLEHEQPLGMLPAGIRIPWVVELKRRVLERLEEWFQASGISPPEDLVVSDEPPTASRVEADALREQVLAAVREMSRAELEALQLPATVLLRGKS